MPDRWDTVKRLFHAALERSPAERDAFLQEACGGDEGLFEEVRSLLASDARGRSLVAEAVREVAGDLTTAGALAGTAVGPYRLIRQVGVGGMGAVYLAERADGQFDQRVALKLVKRGMDSEQILDRFRRERQILAKLQHIHIARLLDGGIAADGQPYFAMEYVEGEPIDAYADRRRLTVEQRLALFLDVCAAVTYAHANLVVHRDLKPENILVTAGGEVRLLDFGIAKLLADDGEVATLTQVGHHVMTPAYASPEQVRGEPVGTATDVYSLGVVLYELLAGVPPYEFAGTSLVEVARVVCDTPVERPSTRLVRATGEGSRTTAEVVGRARQIDARRLRKRLAGDLDVICLKAIRKEPEARYGSVEALMEDVRRHLEGRPVLARADTVGYRVRKAIARHRVAFGTAAGIVVTIASLVAFYTIRLADERDRARLEAAKASEVASFLQGLFEVSDPSESRGETITARELLDQGAARLDRGLADQPEVQASMMHVIGDVYSSLGLYEQALPLLERALARARSLYGENHEEVGRSERSLGVLRQNLGEPEASVRHLRQAVTIFQRVHGAEHPEVASTLGSLAYGVELVGDEAEAERLYRAAAEQQRQFFRPGDPRTAATFVRLGGLLRHTGRLDDAEPVLREALAAQRAAYGNVHPRVASAVRNLASLRRDQGALDEADTLYAEALSIRRRLYGNDHADVAVTLNSHGILLQRKGDHQRALAAFAEAVAILERVYQGRLHPNLSRGTYNMATELRALGRVDDAIARLHQTIQIEREVVRADDPVRAFPLVDLAAIYLTQGRGREAEPLLREAVAIRRQAADDDTDLGQALSDLGACLTTLARYPAADSALAEGYAVLLSAEGADDERTGVARDRLIALYEAWGKPERAARVRSQE
jgi:serine/threonine-protein kinase